MTTPHTATHTAPHTTLHDPPSQRPRAAFLPLTETQRRAAKWIAILVIAAGLIAVGLALLPAPDLSFVPNQATHLDQPCAPDPGATGLRSQRFRARVAVQGLACETCAGSLLRAFEGVKGVCSAHIRIQSHDVLVDYHPSVIDIVALVDLATGAGYPAQAWSEGGPAPAQPAPAQPAGAQ